MFEPEPISAIIAASALVLTAIGGFAFRRGAKDGRAPDPAEELRKVIEANTRAMQSNSQQFTANNGMFANVLTHVAEMNRHMAEIERDGRDSLSVLRSILQEEIRKGRS